MKLLLYGLLCVAFVCGELVCDLIKIKHRLSNIESIIQKEGEIMSKESLQIINDELNFISCKIEECKGEGKDSTSTYGGMVFDLIGIKNSLGDIKNILPKAGETISEELRDIILNDLESISCEIFGHHNKKR